MNRNPDHAKFCDARTDICGSLTEPDVVSGCFERFLGIFFCRTIPHLPPIAVQGGVCLVLRTIGAISSGILPGAALAVYGNDSRTNLPRLRRTHSLNSFRRFLRRTVPLLTLFFNRRRLCQHSVLAAVFVCDFGLRHYKLVRFESARSRPALKQNALAESLHSYQANS